MKATEKLKIKLQEGKHICVGLDTDLKRIPKHLLKFKEPVLEFNKRVIEATKELACSYKLNFAFYETLGAKGFDIMAETLKYIPDDILSIADAKRGDIGNTCLKYAEAIFDGLDFDAITLAPYMGFDSIEPFLKYKEKLLFILGLTSNKSNENFEKLKLEDGKYLYQKVIEKINEWNEFENLGVVFGATNPKELRENISALKNLFTLVPGVGAQGGSIKEISEIFNTAANEKYLINISRGIIYCNSTENFEAAISLKLKEYQDQLS